MRMALFALRHQPQKARELAITLDSALDEIKFCRSCRNLSDLETCPICSNPRRNSKIVCVVESTEDLIAIESSSAFNGKYFVLHGLLSPIDGIGPGELHIDALQRIVIDNECDEVILATNPTIEGNTTAQFISEVLPQSIRVSRIAHGVPVGGELGYVSSRTIAHAIDGRTRVPED